MAANGRRFLVSGLPAIPAPRGLTAKPWVPVVLRGARATAGWLTAIVAVFAGVGLTYLLRGAGAPAVGPRVAGALPLQQLAGGESQPLLRLAVAWLSAGAVAGVALAGLTRVRLAIRVVTSTLIAAALLLAAGAVADAVAVSDPIGPHVAPQLSRAGTWVAAGLYGTGALLVGLLDTRRRRGARRTS